MNELKHLGSGTTEYVTKYDASLLETFSNSHRDEPYTVEITAPEFTCTCPKTKQPDFATIEIFYSPDKLCIESKSLKLYFVSYRNEGAFHEEVTNRIARDLFNLLKPHWLMVKGLFNARGGISFHPVVRLESEEYKKRKRNSAL